MNDTLKMYGSIGSEIMNRYFVVAMCFKSQPRWRRLETTYKGLLKVIKTLWLVTSFSGSLPYVNAGHVAPRFWEAACEE